MRFYIDTCVWRDHLEDRVGADGRPLGLLASETIRKISERGWKLLISRIVLEELLTVYPQSEIEKMFRPLQENAVLETVPVVVPKDVRSISASRRVSLNDVVHAATAGAAGAVLITQDKHFDRLRDLVEVKKPDDLFR